MMPARKLTFQLTPLLDLLLIVIFAQYLDVQSTTRRETRQLTVTRDLLSAQLDAALMQMLQLRERLAELEGEVARNELRGSEADRYRAQRDLIGELVAELFQVPQAELERLLKSRSAAGPGPSANDLDQLRRRWKSLAEGSREEMVDHLLAFGEMRKRIDLWELYLTEAGDLTLTVGDKRYPLRAETSPALAEKLFETYKTLPESKSLVLILFSYGDAKFEPLKGTLDGLPPALERIRRDAAGRSRFEYAVLGFRPTAP